MTTIGVGFSSTQPLLPIFNGEKYEWWSIKIKTLLKSQDLWDLVEYGYVDIVISDEEKEIDEETRKILEEAQTRLKETKKRDAKVLFILQQAVHETIFSRIAAASTAKEAWTTLQNEFQGNARVMVVKLQSLRRDFETLFVQDDESITIFLARGMSIVSQMRSYGEQISDETIVAKILRSLTPKYDHVVAAIEEAKDLSLLSVDELMGSLQAHESRINRMVEKHEEKAFQVRSETIKHEKTDNLVCPYCKKTNHPHYKCWWRPDVKCNRCGQLGHIEKVCKNTREEVNAGMVQQIDKLF